MPTKPRVFFEFGQQFGFLTFIREVETIRHNGKSQRMFELKCHCGKIILHAMKVFYNNKTISCGCEYINNCRLGAIKHGLGHTDIHKVYCSIKSRVSNYSSIKNQKRYFQRGIKMCDEWVNDFKAFYDWAIENGYKKGLQIDRINNDGNYGPSNCRFVTAKVNSNNKSNCVFYEYEGKRLTLGEIASLKNVKYWVLFNRVKYLKMTIDEALANRNYRIDRRENIRK